MNSYDRSARRLPSREEYEEDQDRQAKMIRGASAVTKVERLIERLKTEFEFRSEPEYQRIYSSPAMRSAGCWSWFVIEKGERVDQDGVVRRRDVGSWWNVTQLLAAPEWSITFDGPGDCWQIDPADA